MRVVLDESITSHPGSNAVVNHHSGVRYLLLLEKGKSNERTGSISIVRFRFERND